MSKVLIVGGSKGIGKKISEILENKECIVFSRNNVDSPNSNHHYYNLDVNNGDFPEIEYLSSIIKTELKRQYFIKSPYIISSLNVLLTAGYLNFVSNGSVI